MKSQHKKLIVTIAALLVFSICVILTMVFGDSQMYFSFFVEPWMMLTLIDFYGLILLLLIWLWIKEKSYFMRICFTILFITLGVGGVLIYIISLIYRKKKIL